jgi:choline dehydrogenase
VPTNTRNGVRMSCGLTYVERARKRSNLEIRPDVVVDRVLMSGTRCHGVSTARGEAIEADLVVVSGGAYCSPSILLRSGIGPADELTALGIRVQHDLMGVGRELVDHPLSAIDLPAHPPVPPGPKYHVMLTARSNLAAPNAPPDLHLFPAGPFSAEDYSPTRAVQAILMSVVKPRSRGWVRLRSANPPDSPRIHLGLLDHPEDVARMMEAVRIARRIARHPAMRELIAGPELAPGEAIDDQDDARMERALKSRVETYHHPVGAAAWVRTQRPAP